MARQNQYAPILHTGFANNYTDEQIKAFVKWCSESGYSGFSAEGKSHPPTTDIEGWAKGYLRCVRSASEESEKQGIDVWIFDEWGFPTGTAGGKTLEGHPEFRCKKLYIAVDMLLEKGETARVNVPKNFLAASAWPINIHTFGPGTAEPARVMPEDGVLTYTATRRRERFCAVSYAFEGHQALGIFVPDREDDRQGNIDTLSWEATRRFLDVMHERYQATMADQFGRAIRGFFYDEPYRPYPFAYTYDLPDEFARVKGYDVLDHMPQMLAGIDKQAERDWQDVCTTRMANAFFGQMADWCHEHNLEFVGHQDLDHDVRSLDSVSGNFFKNSMKNDSPGVDYIWDQMYPGHFADFPRFAGSVKHLAGKAHAMSESFAATGRCLHPDYIRWAMEYQMLRGIDRFYLMIADPDMSGNTFRSPFHARHPISEVFVRMINERVALTNKLLDEAVPGARVALYVPMRDIEGAYPPVLPNRISLHMPWDWVNATAEALLYAPIDFEYIWDEALIDNPIIDGALTAPNGQRITTIVIPAVERLPEATLDKLIKFIEAGGKVVCVCAVSRGLIGLAQVAVSPVDISEVVAPTVKLKGCGRVSVAVREYEDGEMIFLLNEDRKPYTGELTETGCLAEFDYEKRKWYNRTGSELNLAPMQLRVFKRALAAEEMPALGESAVIGGWTANTPDGRKVELGCGLKDWREFMDGTYVGFVEYEAEFDAPTSGAYRVDLGRVCYSAVVTVDGKEYKLPFAPYGFDVTLDKGAHTIKVKVLNTAVNEVLGTPEAEREATEREYSLSYKSYETTRFVNDRHYVTSGLLGPVTIAKYQ